VGRLASEAGKPVRLWTLHPRYLDSKGLVAVWREGLLAQAVLLGKTKGYRHHPQLIRFQQQRNPVAAIATYLAAIHEDSLRRGYRFDKSLLQSGRMRKSIVDTRGQVQLEWTHLRTKLQVRSPNWFSTIQPIRIPDPHPLFTIQPGPVQPWEKQT